MLPLPAPLPQWPPRATVQYIPYCVLSNERWTKAKKRRESVGGVGDEGGSGYAFVWRITVGHAVAAPSSSLSLVHPIFVTCITCNALRSCREENSV